MDKKLLTLIAMVLAGICIASMPDPIGRKVNKNTKMPEGWLVQGQPTDKASIKVMTNEKGLTTYVLFKPIKPGFIFFCGNALSYQKGDVIKLTCKVKGTGKVKLGYIAYSDSNKYLFSYRGKELILTGKEKIFSESFTIKDGKDFATETIRPFLAVLENCKVELIGFTLSDEE